MGLFLYLKYVELLSGLNSGLRFAQNLTLIMNQNTEYNKIDNVLEYICNVQQPPFRTGGEISKDLKFDQNSKELFEILWKLEDEKFIHSELDANNIKKYFSTFNGRLFLKNNGYKGRNKEIIRQRKRLNALSVLSIVNIIAILILTCMNYIATDKANDNKDEVTRFELTINKKNKTIDSLLNITRRINTHIQNQTPKQETNTLKVN